LVAPIAFPRLPFPSITEIAGGRARAEGRGSHRKTIGKPGAGDSDEDIVVRTKAMRALGRSLDARFEEDYCAPAIDGQAPASHRTV